MIGCNLVLERGRDDAWSLRVTAAGACGAGRDALCPGRLVRKWLGPMYVGMLRVEVPKGSSDTAASRNTRDACCLSFRVFLKIATEPASIAFLCWQQEESEQWSWSDAIHKVIVQT